MKEPLKKLRTLLMCVLLPLPGGVALAHATIVFGTLTPQPNPPRADAPLQLRLELVDPASVPVEDAFVLAEFELDGEPTGSVRFEEAEPAGHYLAELELPRAGTYGLTLRDQTFRQEEAIADMELPVGTEGRIEPIEFVFPPTAVGGSLTTWLVWLIGVPIVAGLVVTLLVLRSGPAEGSARKERE